MFGFVWVFFLQLSKSLTSGLIENDQWLRLHPFPPPQGGGNASVYLTPTFIK